MPTRLIAVLATLVVASIAAPAAQSDLDAFMREVLAHRDENWKKLQQYTLEERENFQVLGTNGQRLYGFRRDYTWYPDGAIFMRSPLRVDGVDLSEADRRKEEKEWVDWEQRRATRAARREARERAAADGANSGRDIDDRDAAPDDDREKDDDQLPGSADAPSLDELVNGGMEPRFVSSAYFMKFKFDPGHYALAGRETLLGRDVLRIEYYPSKLFANEDDRRRREERAREGKTDRGDQVEAQVERKMNKVSKVTLWIERASRQIVQYEFENVDMDFLPGRQLLRLDGITASMRMFQPFPDVWLPETIDMRFGMSLAVGAINARYDVRYHDYRLATTGARLR